MTDNEESRPPAKDEAAPNGINSSTEESTPDTAFLPNGQEIDLDFLVGALREKSRAILASPPSDAPGHEPEFLDPEGCVFSAAPDAVDITGDLSGFPVAVTPREFMAGKDPALRADLVVAYPGEAPEYMENVLLQGAALVGPLQKWKPGKTIPGRLEEVLRTENGQTRPALVLAPLNEVEHLLVVATVRTALRERAEAQSREDRVKAELDRLRARDEAARRHAEETGQAVDYTSSLRAHSAGSWLSVEEEEVEPLWGTQEVQLWAPGESTMLVGPPSVGKSTLAHLLIWGRLGLIPEVLGFPVKPDTEGGVLYLAMDRPSQIRRAMRRLVRESDIPEAELARVLDERMTIWEGPLPVDITENPRYLVTMAQHYGRNTIVIDSTKDVLPNASDEAKAGGYNIARQEALAEGLNWLELHHNRKSNGDSKEPNALDDVYGSRWITAGAGSVLSLYGQPGDIVVKLTHLKPLAEPLFPKDVLLDRATGGMSLHEEMTPEKVLAVAGPTGITVTDAAALLFDGKKPTKSQVESTRNKLDRLIKSGRAIRTDGNPAKYHAAGDLEFIPTAETGAPDPYAEVDS